MERAKSEGDMAILTYRDPETGKVQYTDRGSARAASKAKDARAAQMGLLGAAAMGLITYKGLGPLLGAKAAILPSMLTSAGTGAALYTQPRDGIKTDQGIPVDPSVQFRVREASLKLGISLGIDYARNKAVKTASTVYNLSQLAYIEDDLDFDKVAFTLGRALLG